jgi:sulfatase maturation enzyme AslB (radical SAM superfamily)
MEISNFSLIVTDHCNYNCSYCFQEKEKKYMSRETIEKAISFFYPFFKKETDIVFYGGEPLLAFDNIKYAVSLLHEKSQTGGKKFTFYLTTNGSLIDENILDFFHRHRFDIMLSFDGLAHEKNRKTGAMPFMLELVKRIPTYPGIAFSVNSVFTPETAGGFFESLRFIIEQGAPEILVSLASTQPWPQEALDALTEEYKRLIDFLVSYYSETGKIPVNDFKIPQGPPRKGFACGAGRDRMAIAPDGGVWGCYLFHDYLKTKKESSDYKSYHFGRLDDFTENHETRYPAIMENYADLRQDMFFTEDSQCFLCPDLDHCGTCPVNAANSTSFIGKIPACLCSLNRVQKNAKDRFLEKIAGLTGKFSEKQGPSS